MKNLSLLQMCLVIACSISLAWAQSYEEEVGKLSNSLSKSLEKAGLKTVAIGGFRDLQGKETGLGKLLIEDLSVDLVNQDKGVSVVDRANLSRLMDEYKLTEEGLIDPENTKKLKLAGIDALILGTIVPFEQTYRISAKAIATDSAKVVAATRGSVTQTDSLNSLMGVSKLQSTAGATTALIQGSKEEGAAEEPVKKDYDLGDVTVTLKSLEFFKKTGRAKVTFTVKYNAERGYLFFAYHLIDKNAPQDDFRMLGQRARVKKGYKPDYRLVGEATDDKGQSYSMLLPRDATSQPKLPAQAEVAFAIEYQIAAEAGATILIPSALTFSVEIFAGSVYSRMEKNTSKWSVVNIPIDKVY